MDAKSFSPVMDYRKYFMFGVGGREFSQEEGVREGKGGGRRKSRWESENISSVDN